MKHIEDEASAPKLKKTHIKKRTWVNERKYKKDYAGTEASPYRDYLGEKGDRHQDHDDKEPIQANPDQLSEDQGLYYQVPVNDPRIGLVKEMWHTFTPMQQNVLQMCGYEGRSLDNCAVKLGVSKSRIQNVLSQVKKKINKGIRSAGLSSI